jgi:hypothetical protein
MSEAARSVDERRNDIELNRSLPGTLIAMGYVVHIPALEDRQAGLKDVFTRVLRRPGGRCSLPLCVTIYSYGGGRWMVRVDGMVRVGKTPVGSLTILGPLSSVVLFHDLSSIEGRSMSEWQVAGSSMCGDENWYDGARSHS